MDSHVQKLISDLWIFMGVLWLVMALRTKRAVRSQSMASRLAQSAIAALAYFVGFTPRFRVGVLAERFVPQTLAMEYAGLGIVVVGLAFAVWARFYLGDNWSGRVTVKENHMLMTGGPYAVVRHPIYTGLLAALFGTAVAFGQVRGLVAAAIVGVMLYLKSRVEERFMVEQFGEQYVGYRERVKGLVPFVI